MMIVMAVAQAVGAFFICVISVSAKLSELTLLTEAAEKQGAVCLDGSPPGYYYRKGTGNTAKKWIIFLEGGGWCFNEQDCYERSNTDLGSSKKWQKLISLDHQGILSYQKDANPDFFEWNSVFVPYCDGVSFTGNRIDTIVVKGKELHFRGFQILTAVIESLLDLGLRNADTAILSGCSAGGLAVYYHLDYVRSLIPSNVALSGLADAGYMVDVQNINGEYPLKELILNGFKLHNTTSGENRKCVQDHPGNNSVYCLLPAIVYPYISTPLFSLNSQYDTWQLQNILQVNCLPPNCNTEQMKAIQNFREEFLKAAAPIIQSKQNGAFLDSCLAHCQSRDDKHWSTVFVGNKTAYKTFGDWFFQRSNDTKEIDCAYPCNETC